MQTLALIVASLAIALSNGSSAPITEADESKWAARLKDEDRAPLEKIKGFALTEFPEQTTWINGSPGSFESLRGKVVIIQTFNTRNTLGRGATKKLDRALGELAKNDELEVLLVHTPDGVDKAERYLERVEITHPVALDRTGTICDGLGAFKRPVNILVDRQGNVRYAGLTDKGAALAATKLLGETYDPTMPANERPVIDTETTGFPRFTASVGSARDLRGQRAPEFFVQQWITAEPNGRGKVAVIDFWATWCGPCVAAIPHMNELQTEFASDVVCVGLSDESSSKFQEGLRNRKLNASNFKYALGLDPSGRMKNAFQVRGIPHVAVISSDWIVRWQGHPSRLTSDVMSQIVTANRSIGSGGEQGGGNLPPARWQKTRR